MLRWFVLITLSVLAGLGFVAIGVNVQDKATGPVDPKSRERMILNIGYDLSNPNIPITDIMSGGVAKDGIPAIHDPQYITATDEDAKINKDQDRVIGVVLEGEARAYPLRILNYHEIVNSTSGNQNYTVSYCPLCDSAAVYDRDTEMGELKFGVSGLLYNSNVLMYNLTESEEDPQYLFSQVKSRAVGGKAAEFTLKGLPMELTTWAEWKKRYPDTKVLTSAKPYEKNPYLDYFARPQLSRPARPLNPTLPLKTPVLGVWTENRFRAYQVQPFAENQNRLEDEIEGKKIVLEYIPDSNSLRVIEAEDGVQWMYSFWFAWAAMHPPTELYAPEGIIKSPVDNASR